MANSFQILQINLISARDLAAVSKSMSTYAMIWIDPTRKLRTRVDEVGDNCPQWNDRFPFRLSSEFLHSDKAIVTIEIYTASWIRDTIVGSVRVPVSSIVPANPTRQARRAVALQIRRPSGRPKGICNITVSLLSMPLSGLDGKIHTQPENDQKSQVGGALQRAKSERSCLYHEAAGKQEVKGSEINVPGGSICNSDVRPSPSVVAAGMAKGLHAAPRPPGVGGGPNPKGNGNGVKDDEESCILQWADEDTDEAAMTQIKKWKTELNRPVQIENGVRRQKRVHRKKQAESGGKLFGCLGNGFEFTIVCGANHDENKNGNKSQHRKKIIQRPPSDADSTTHSHL